MVPKLLQKSVRTKKQLGDVVDFIDGDRGRNYPSQGEFSSDGYCLFLSTKNVPDSSFSFSEKMFVTEEKDSQLRKGKLQRGDYVLTTRGTVGNFAYYNQKIPFKNVRINSGMVILRVKSDDLNRDYLKFYLESNSFKEQVNGRVSGSAQPQLPIRDMLTMGIDLPDIKTQAAIASFLSSYDDLIENNAKRIKILEEMAQLLYTEWFVKFKFPGHEKVKMVESGTEYGMIPEGWEVKRLATVVSFLEGPGLRNWQYRTLGVPFLNIRTIGNGDIDISKCNYLDEEEVKTKYPHFLLNANDLVISSSGTLGRLAVIRKRHLPLCLNTSVIRFREIGSGASIWFIKQLLLSEVFQNRIRGLASGSAQLNYGPSHLETISIIMPTLELLREYSQKVSPMESAIGTLRDSIQILTQIRALLIPQLVTGKRKIKL